jgi:hypothetical protein
MGHLPVRNARPKGGTSLTSFGGIPFPIRLFYGETLRINGGGAAAYDSGTAALAFFSEYQKNTLTETTEKREYLYTTAPFENADFLRHCWGNWGGVQLWIKKR